MSDTPTLRRVGLAVIKVGRTLFYNTWVHRLTITGLLYRILFSSLYRGQPETIVDYEGCRFHISTHDITILPRLLSDDYEKAEIRLFRRLLRPGMRVVDLGANIGVYTVIAASCVGPRGRVFAFEPAPENVAFLRRNLEANGIANVQVVSKAVGDSPQTVKLYLAAHSVGTHSVSKVGPQSIDVEVIRVDDAIPSNETIDVIKMDIEGFEPAALRGMSRILAASMPTLFVEYNPTAVGRCGFSAPDFFDDICRRYPYVYAVEHEQPRMLDARARQSVRASGQMVNLILTSHEIQL